MRINKVQIEQSAFEVLRDVNIKFRVKRKEDDKWPWVDIIAPIKRILELSRLVVMYIFESQEGLVTIVKMPGKPLCPNFLISAKEYYDWFYGQMGEF